MARSSSALAKELPVLQSFIKPLSHIVLFEAIHINAYKPNAVETHACLKTNMVDTKDMMWPSNGTFNFLQLAIDTYNFVVMDRHVMSVVNYRLDVYINRTIVSTVL